MGRLLDAQAAAGHSWSQVAVAAVRLWVAADNDAADADDDAIAFAFAADLW